MSGKSQFDIIIRTLKQGAGEKEAAAGLKSVVSSIEQFTGIGISSLSIMTALGAGFAFIVKAASEAEQAGTRLNAVLDATDGQSGMTMESLDRLAQRISNLTGIDDENVQSAEALLLTYRSINSDVFPRTMELAADLSATFGVDLTTAVKTLGKALDSPTTGLTALRRMGVIFTEEQQAMIRSLVEENRLFDAQTVILDALEGRVGGVAEAMGNTFAGQVNKLKNEWENFCETIGGPVVVTLGNAIGLLNTLFQWDQRIQDTLIDHSQQMVELSGSYEEYEEELRRAAEAQGYQINSEGDLVEIVRTRNETTETLISSNYLLSQSDYEGARAAAANAAAQADLDLAYQSLRTTISGQFGAENERYRDQLGDLRDRAADLSSQIGELEGRSYLTDVQEEDLANLRQDLADTQTSITDLATAHEEAMRRMAFNMLMEQASSDGLTENELSNLTAIGQAWGLFDQTTANMIEAVNGNLDDMDSTELNQYLVLLQNILGLPTYREFTFVTRFETIGGQPFATTNDYQNLYGVTGYANGVENMIVPQGYPDDSYLIGVSTGERVTVVPASENESPRTSFGSNGSSNNPTYIQVYLDGQLISQQLANNARYQGVR